MAKAIKTAISLPLEEFQFIESVRKKTHQSRSRILLEAIHTWLAVRKREELDQKYIQGYQKHPERKSDLDRFFHASLPSFGEKEKW